MEGGIELSIKEGRDYLHLVWKQPKTRRRYVVGELSKNGQFEFLYGKEVNAALAEGFEPIIAFPDIKKRYKSDKLFSVFAGRLPDPKRKGINNIIAKYGLEQYDAYQLLKRSGARLPIDQLEFIDPILDHECENFSRRFFLAGPRHYLGCKGIECSKAIDVKLHENLTLLREPENEKDELAIKVISESGDLIGYVPRYYSPAIAPLIDQGVILKCVVVNIEKENNCDECIEVELSKQ